MCNAIEMYCLTEAKYKATGFQWCFTKGEWAQSLSDTAEDKVGFN